MGSRQAAYMEDPAVSECDMQTATVQAGDSQREHRALG